MELYLKITYLNDFIFCPLSIYYHQLYGELTDRLYYSDVQLDVKAAHAAVDEKKIQLTKTYFKELMFTLMNINCAEKSTSLT